MSRFRLIRVPREFALNLALFQHLLRQNSLHIVGKTISSDLGGDRWDSKARMHSLKIEKLEHKDLLVSHTFSAQQTSVIGLSYLSRYQVTFDFPKRQLLYSQESTCIKDSNLTEVGFGS